MWCSSTHAPSWQRSTAWWMTAREMWRWGGGKCRRTNCLVPKYTQRADRLHLVMSVSCWEVSCFLQVWRIENLELAEVNRRTYGQFYGGDCYLVLYSYQRAGQQQYILYMWQVSVVSFWFLNSLLFWRIKKRTVTAPYHLDFMFVPHQGRHATTDEITACAYQAINVDNKYNGAPVQVRVVMGKEPRHFLAIFKGRLIIFEVRLLTPRSSSCWITIVKIQNRSVASLCVYLCQEAGALTPAVQ